MTILVGWTRNLGEYEELLFASDSRNSGDGRTFDYCPKLMLLPRSDCAIGYAGYTGNAYPLMLQLSNAIAAYPPAQSRVMDIAELKTHILKVFDEIVKSIGNQVEEGDPDDFEFLFGGYSWLKRSFRLWRISFQRDIRRFVAHPAWRVGLPRYPGARLSNLPAGAHGCIGLIAFAGDMAPQARQLFHTLIGDGSALRNNGDQRLSIDMEPFEVVRSLLLRPGKSKTIGGPPQVVKVYQHHNAAALSVWWRSRGTAPLRKFLLGRPLLDYERGSTWTLDPYSYRLTHAEFSAQESLETATRNFERGRLLDTFARRISTGGT